MKWEAARLDTLLACIESGSRPKGGATAESGEVPSLGGENILATGGVDVTTVKRIPVAFYRALSKGRLQDGDVLINKDGANTGKVGFFREQAGSQAAINEHLFLLRGVTTKIRQKYLYYSLLSPQGQRQVRQRISGSAQPGLKSDFASGVVIDIPDLDGQDRTVSTLSLIDDAIDTSKEIIDKQHRIKRGLMQDLLTKGVDENGSIRSPETHEFKDSVVGPIPASWEALPIADLTSVIVDGTHVTPSYTPSGIRFLVVSDLTAGFDIDFDHTRLVSPEAHGEYTRRVCPRPGDVLVSKDGTLGVARVVPHDAPPFSIFVSVALLRPRLDRCLPELLWAFFESGEFYRQLAGLSAGTGLAHIHLEHFRRFIVRRPPIEEQERVLAVIRGQQQVLREEYSTLDKLWRLRAGLLQSLLRTGSPVTKAPS